MITQTITNIINCFSLLDLALFEDDQQPIRFSASDLGYEINEDDLVDEMSASFHANLIDQPTTTISPDEFESVYNWFVS